MEKVPEPIEQSFKGFCMRPPSRPAIERRQHGLQAVMAPGNSVLGSGGKRGTVRIGPEVPGLPGPRTRMSLSPWIVTRRWRERPRQRQREARKRERERERENERREGRHHSDAGEEWTVGGV
eukprot:scaffold7342_cov269-Pinguiococcus_pyrenoidosus.AAC.7